MTMDMKLKATELIIIDWATGLVTKKRSGMYSGLRRTNCTFCDDWVKFADVGHKQCSKHVEACIEQLKRDETLEFAAPAAKEGA